MKTSVVYEWAEDYYHKEEKPETSQKRKRDKKPATNRKNARSTQLRKLQKGKKDIQEKLKNDSKVCLKSRPQKKDAASKPAEKLKNQSKQKQQTSHLWTVRCPCSIFCRRMSTWIKRKLAQIPQRRQPQTKWSGLLKELRARILLHTQRH